MAGKEADAMKSAIYTGWLEHRRFSPRAHQFRYQVFMMYVDLSEVDSLCQLSPFWSSRRLALARFKRADFFGDQSINLDTAVRQRVEEETGEQPKGPIRLLANWRYFGYNMNPISVYYCFDIEGEHVDWLLLDIHNTPWKERHSYVLDCRNNIKLQKATFEKTFHVSPFMPMAQGYHWRGTKPGEKLTAYLQNFETNAADTEESNRPMFDATLRLHRRKISAAALNSILIQYPLMTLKVIAIIYWQALKLWVKRVPVFSHPRDGAEVETGDKQR
ncbi:DUF1365 domain-containing protein [Microbulbifer sp. OS29]|uniref:DUF1365 domain-containing protein n=1 Tax=Microbulbifer okhotskensis TaxID=2926617 RepID=A0A9X2J707_9GAMM|nr:DUF1365 domain-containing protein [Microbulbifer okhotskensis]MCO1336044.1 DUF1365 domain-containing protein [Microbulbifer okhotskensis]